MPFLNTRIDLSSETGRINKDTLVLSWNDGNPRTASSDASGVFSGDASGVYDVEGNALIVRFFAVPKKGTVITIDYDVVPFVTTYSFNYFSLKNGDDSIDLVLNNGSFPILHVDIKMTYDWLPSMDDELVGLLGSDVDRKQSNYYAKDDGVGGIVINANPPQAFTNGGNATFNGSGTIDVNNGNLHLVPSGIDDVMDATIVTDNDQRYITAITTKNGNTGFPTSRLPEISIVVTHTGSTTTGQILHTLDQIELALNNTSNDAIISDGTVRLTIGGSSCYDNAGSLFFLPSITAAPSAITVGSVNYSTRIILIDQWSSITNNPLSTSGGTIPSGVIVESATSQVTVSGVSRVAFRIPNAPVRVESFQLRFDFSANANPSTGYDLESISVDSDAAGIISKTTLASNGLSNLIVTGTIDYETGVVQVDFTHDNSFTVAPTFVSSESIVYNAVSQTFLPLDESILGLDPIRLPNDGRVPVFDQGDVILIHNTISENFTPASNSQDTLSRDRLAEAIVTDSAGNALSLALYDLNLDTGVIDWNDLSGIGLPIGVEHRIEELSLLNDVQITGKLSTSQPITHDYPADGNTLVSNAVIHGDVFASVSEPFDQVLFTGIWSDAIIGSDTLGELNVSQHPIIVDNASCVEERWLVQFVSGNAVNIIGENSGQVLTNVAIGVDIAPINPATSFPYFTIPNAAFGGGWSAGNVIRFNTLAANKPIWFIRSISQGVPANEDVDALEFCVSFRGSRNAVI